MELQTVTPTKLKTLYRSLSLRGSSSSGVSGAARDGGGGVSGFAGPQFAIDVRLSLPAVCPDCGGDVLARTDIEGSGPAGPAAGDQTSRPGGV